ncbi:Iojap protein [Acetivibrio straminisolvens JCM 21531]|uniref:Iojap protein n=1 Tax=Acetivibrio straminisolvens JCM 21531 TaxID=1294263 RepID=W4VBL7_9FIRM|nr:Iojap protein [Acetivibrio straminisolvens JCM 21531]
MEEKKAKDLNTIDIREISILADYFIICSGTSTTHIRLLPMKWKKKCKRLA